MERCLPFLQRIVGLGEGSRFRSVFAKHRVLAVLVMMALLAISFLLVPAVALAADPTGGVTLAANPNMAVNMAWTLITGFLVWFMQLGFAFLGAGLIRSKNQANYWTKSFMDFCISSIGFWAFGFALMFGGSKLFSGLDHGNSFIGYSGFFLSGESYDVSTMMMWFFQMCFMATACTIVAGAVAERMKITAYLAYAFIIGAVVYPIYGKWIWGGGWLSGAHGRRPVGSHRGRHGRPQDWEVQQGWHSQRHTRPQPAIRGHRDFRPLLRVVRIQPREHSGGHGSADLRHRGQHVSRRSHRRRGSPLLDLP